MKKIILEMEVSNNALKMNVNYYEKKINVLKERLERNQQEKHDQPIGVE